MIFRLFLKWIKVIFTDRKQITQIFGNQFDPFPIAQKINLIHFQMKLDQNDFLAIFEMDRSDFRRLKRDQIEFWIQVT